MKYPIGIQSFDRIIEGGFVYVDKTELLYNLVHESSIYFLSRPRRFGKSLLLSTLEVFRGTQGTVSRTGHRTAGNGMGSVSGVPRGLQRGNFFNPGELEAILQSYVSRWEKKYGVQPESDVSVGNRFARVLEAAHEQTGRRCVVLIDEYDKPILDVLDADTTLEDRHRNVLKGFYSVFKAADSYLQFVLLTG